MKTLASILGPFAFYLLFANSLWSQTAWERSVLLSAEVDEVSPSIRLNWPIDVSATDYQVYKKDLEADSWGDAIASLAGNATSFLDTDVDLGKIYEYALFKKNFDPVLDTLCLESGLQLEFAINDMYGIGLCCNFGFGYYELSACGEQLAYGDNFGYADTTYFTLCDNGNACEELTITLIPDMFPNSTSWTLKNSQTGELLASSGPVGTFISERPKYGFISAGIKVAPSDERGTMLLLVENQIASALSPEIEQLKLDLIKDHWKVLQRNIDAQAPVTEVRTLLQSFYQNTPDLKALYLLGHIPVPYSGDIYPDTHSENHRGAWSADTYYAELNGHWTDETVTSNSAFFDRNKNNPGDGKFDQDSIPSKVELQVGRVDLSNMPAFALDEIELTRRYLQKAHAYKTGVINAERRALIDDNFGQAFAGPAASGWRNFAPMFGADQIVEEDYFETMRTESYLWSYGCGSGSHLSSAGIGTTDDFAQDSLLSIFTMLFGSQFGDWDNPNNFLRAPLASGHTLTNCWAGSPPWSFHQMALGYPIGYCAFRSMNSIDGVYLNGPQLVHLALLGDPSLRMFMLAPLAENGVTSESDGSAVKLTWQPSTSPAIAGYYVYRSDSLNGTFSRISNEVITDTFFMDTDPLIGRNVYQVKVVQLEISASGSYYNQSLGIIDSIDFSPIVGLDLAAVQLDFQLYPNPASADLILQLEKALEQETRAYLLDAHGTIVQSWLLKKGSRHIRQSVDKLANGLYFVKLGRQVTPLVISSP